jgi:hypothetical protein
MTPGSPLAAAVFAIVVTAVLARGGAAQTAVEIATGAKFDVAPGGTVEFRGVNGEATFVGAPGTQVVVFYARDVPADVKIVTFSTPAGLTVCTVYVSTDPKKPTECLPGGKGRLAAGRIRDQSRVRFRIQVPRGVHVRAGIDQGDLSPARSPATFTCIPTTATCSSTTAAGPARSPPGLACSATSMRSSQRRRTVPRGGRSD